MTRVHTTVSCLTHEAGETAPSTKFFVTGLRLLTINPISAKLCMGGIYQIAY